MKKKKSVTRIDILGDLNIFNAAEQRERLLDALEVSSEVEVDLSHVTEIDTTGIQLMIAAKYEAAARNKPLRFTGHSPEVVDILDLCDLAGHFGDPMLIQSRT